jgi:hypothetical protein
MFIDDINLKARELLVVDLLEARLKIGLNLNESSLSLASSSNDFETRLELDSIP